MTQVFKAATEKDKKYYPHLHCDGGVVAWLSLLPPLCKALVVGCGNITQDLTKPERISFNFTQKL